MGVVAGAVGDIKSCTAGDTTLLQNKHQEMEVGEIERTGKVSEKEEEPPASRYQEAKR
jgi:hypothetical protein